MEIMKKTDDIFNKATLDRKDIITLLGADDKESLAKIRSKAYDTMKQYCGEEVYLRGLIEFSNMCVNDCYYCGIRNSNENVSRYILEKDEILEIADWCAGMGYGSIVLQSGERSDEYFVDYVADAVREIKKRSISDKLPHGLGITLCIGEQSYEAYRKLFEAGAHRYLLRIETTNPELFSKIHPPELSLESRIECLYSLRKAGFQVGTGVMIGLPGQTIENLADDILFFKEMDVDMIGMGPYIIHKQTPMNVYSDEIEMKREDIFSLALKMIGVTRIVLKNVNIASTTALQAMDPAGREEGLLWGANVIMPMLTPTKIRKDYQLYEGKPCLDEFASDCHACLKSRIESIGRNIAYDVWGDSKHFVTKLH